MDGQYSQPYDVRSRSSHPRTASRSSTSTTQTRMTSQSANSSSSQISQSPQLAAVHPVHRLHHAACSNPTGSPRATPRATPRLSREGSTESARQPVVSSFLQERLQKERKVESEKAASWSRVNQDMTASVELPRPGYGSPSKSGDADLRRPQSTSGSEGAKKKGMGVKDMEQVISNLHKQNFDLKLELFHRRERQTFLEERVEALESEKLQADEQNEKLVQELEKRDKAVEEAVAMIVTLEAKMEQFAQERGMVRQIESEGNYTPYDISAGYEQPAPNMRAPDVMKLEDDVRGLTRMPSFLSDRSENTENLRNVYLGVKGSVLSLPQVPEGAADAAPGLASPSLSVLSESSFVSVYGQKEQPAKVPPVDEPLSLDGADTLGAKGNNIRRPRTSLASARPSSSRTARSNSLTNSSSRQAQHQFYELEQATPQAQVERTSQMKAAREVRPESRGNEGVALTSRQNLSPVRRSITREEKRQSLRRVLTDAPGGVRLHDQALPPTPDTISTSTLRRFQNSSETLSKQPGVSRSHKALSDASGDEDDTPGLSSGAPLADTKTQLKATAMPKEFGEPLTFEDRARAIQRPRSADETTVSHKRQNDWDSDSDDSDTHSLESSLDIWMRESVKPSRKGGRGSPDLFGFPNMASSGAGWATDAMFGPASAFMGGVPTTIDYERVLDLFPAQQELFSSFGPPPPNRRSSLHAQTGTSPGSMPQVRAAGNPNRSKQGTRRVRHSRRNSDGAQVRTETQPTVQPHQPAPEQQKKNHYPPIAGQQGVRNGLTKLFRRSLGGGSTNTEAAAAVATVTAEAAPADVPKNQAAMGAPSWAGRGGVAEEDLQSATPPPIMRNPRHSRHASVDMGPGMSQGHGGSEAADPSTPTNAAAPAGGDASTPENLAYGSPRVPSATGHRKKWPFSRGGILKTKTG